MPWKSRIYHKIKAKKSKLKQYIIENSESGLQCFITSLNSMLYIVDSGLLTTFLWRCLILPSLFFQTISNSPNCLLYLIIWQIYTYWVPQVQLALLPQALIYANMCQVYYRFDTNDMVFASTLIWFHKHIQTNTFSTQGQKNWHIKIY